MTIIEKIIALHSTYDKVKPGEIVDIQIDLRAARDNGGVSIVKQIRDNNLPIADASKTLFSFDCDPILSDPIFVENQHICREFANEHGIRIFDTHAGIGSHLIIDKGLAVPGIIAVSTDTHFNILGAVGALGLIMVEKDITAAFSKGKIWFRIPKSVKINLKGKLPANFSAKDVALNMLSIFGFNKLLGYAVEITGEVLETFSIDARMTLASMASEMGAVTFILKPNQEVIDYCQSKSGAVIEVLEADANAEYENELNLSVDKFTYMIAKSENPFEITPLEKVANTKIDLAYVGTCTNGRIEDLRIVAGILNKRTVSPNVVLKIAPATDDIWKQALQEGLIDIFKEAGAIVLNAGCAGCGACGKNKTNQKSLGESTITTGNRNFPGRLGRGEIFLASPAVVAASAIAGHITSPENIPVQAPTFITFQKETSSLPQSDIIELTPNRPTFLEGKVWNIPFDNIHSDMIFNNRYAELTELSQIGNYAFSNLTGFEDFSSKANPGDIIITGHNFGIGDSIQQTVDCFRALGIQAIVAKSFATFYERNAINAGFPIIVCSHIDELLMRTDDILSIDLLSGKIENKKTGKFVWGEKFSGIQMNIYQHGGLFFT